MALGEGLARERRLLPVLEAGVRGGNVQKDRRLLGLRSMMMEGRGLGPVALCLCVSMPSGAVLDGCTNLDGILDDILTI